MIIDIIRDPQDFSNEDCIRIAGNIWLDKRKETDGTISIFTSQNESFIPANIIDYRLKDTLLIVKQKRVNHHDYMFPNPGLVISNYPYSEDSTYYWFVFVSTDSFWGPYSYDSIVKLYDYYKVDSSLRLK